MCYISSQNPTVVAFYVVASTNWEPSVQIFEHYVDLRSRRSGGIPNCLAPPRTPLSPAAGRTYHTLILSASLCSFVSCLMQKMNASEQNELGVCG